MKVDLASLAHQVMLEKGLQPDFSREELQQLSHLTMPAPIDQNYPDHRSFLWCSIDNDDSRDLDQLTYAEKGSNGETTLWIAIADVDALVDKDTPIDVHARINTTSVYTPAKIFPMLPEQLSTNLTSLNEGEDRLAIVVRIKINSIGEVEESFIAQAIVHNYAKLTYSAIGRWLEGESPVPDNVKQVKGLEEALRIQHEAAQLLKQRRHEAGSLTLETAEAEVKVDHQNEISIQLPAHNFAHQLIEEFMIAANCVTASYFNQAKIPSLRRVVRTPKYWDRIVELANGYGEFLPDEPDSKALEAFLMKRKKEDAESFPDLSLTVIKLLGRGEYIVESDQEDHIGHFSLALSNYTHSTAPNRRFPDLITQRQYKAFSRGNSSPYSLRELDHLAKHCSEQEDAAMKVERQLNKSAAALSLSSQIGTVYQGIITGASEKGTWVRLFHPAVEGKVIEGFENLKVGNKVTVQLTSVNIVKGYIDFVVVF